MLLLAQNSHEAILLETSDGTIEVRVTRIDGDEARIGIEVPPSVRIIRRELKQPPADLSSDISNPPEPVSASQAVAAPEQATAGFETDLAPEEDTEDLWWLHPSEQSLEQDLDADMTPELITGPAMAAAADD